MGDQQERTVGLDFIAGLAVGEGSFILGAHRVAKRRGSLKITPAFYMQMNDRETMEIVGETLKQHGLAFWGPAWDEKRGRSVLQINGAKRLSRFLEVFLPLLTGTKARSATIVNEFIESRLSQPHRQTPYTEHELSLVKKLRATNGIAGKHPNRLPL